MRIINELLPQLDMANQSLGNSVVVGSHRLADTCYFDHQNLVSLIEAHPDADLGISTMGADPCQPSDWRDGDRNGVGGAELLEAVESGRLWLNLRRATQNHGVIRELVDQLYEELERKTPGLRTFKRSANLLISSPSAIVYYHMDCPFNILWHIEGTKRVWVYPPNERLLPNEIREAVLAGDSPEELHYDPTFDEEACVFDLQPGQFITWPLHSPHRVVNTRGLNVSLSTEHYTRDVMRQNNVLLANRYLRSWSPRLGKSASPTGLAAILKESAIRIVRRIPALAPKSSRAIEYAKSFSVDMTAHNCVRLRETSTPEPVLV